jgi:hypothetical protein
VGQSAGDRRISSKLLLEGNGKKSRKEEAMVRATGRPKADSRGLGGVPHHMFSLYIWKE